MLATLLERDTGVALPLSRALIDRYGGELRFPAKKERHVFANFVSTLDGVVSYDEPGIDRAEHVSDGHAADRFVLALLRAAADAVIVGAGTLRREPGSVWTAQSVEPDLAEHFADLRKRWRRAPYPTTVIVTASGDVDPELPVFRGPAPVVIATTRAGAARAPRTKDARVEVVAEDEPLPSVALIDVAVRASGGRHILTEGGPTLFAQLAADHVVDELFLTIAPRLAGRTEEKRRVALVEGVAFTPDRAPRGALLSLKAADDYLFARYAVR